MADSNPRRDEVVRELMRHRSSLFAYILSIVRRFDLAEEILQEVAVVVCERADEFQPGTNFGAWAMRIARNKIFNATRAARRHVVLSEEALDAVERAGPEAPPSAWIEAVQACLDRLARRAREILLLRYRDGLSGADIARRVGGTVTAVHMALSRARAAVADCVLGRLAEEDGP
ncbi:MAG TPA: sigma-70 family RNA polymerase sigma factor [Planctomycetota bacterium]|jgi:RNA polymerase sigma-70 factor (ECF subfamily)|nr:sigma-70 family RNA polymerase sigma factor [Planctomycetota bacterium]